MAFSQNATYNESMTKFSRYLFTLVLFLSLQTAVSAKTDLSSDSDIRILADKHQSIEEYRSNGKIYMIKVKPKKGPAYYLIDADGDGNMDTRRNDLSPNLLIPSWVLFSW